MLYVKKFKNSKYIFLLIIFTIHELRVHVMYKIIFIITGY